MLKLLPPKASAGVPTEAPEQVDAEPEHAHDELEDLEDHDDVQPVVQRGDLESEVAGVHEVPDGVQSPEEAGAERVGKAHADAEVLLGEAAGNQGLAPKPMPSPRVPTREEYERHVLTHIPYRNWCRHCVASRKPNIAHRSRRSCKERTIPLLAIDYCFLRDTEDGEPVPCVVAVLAPFRVVVSFVVGVKGGTKQQQEDSDTSSLAQACTTFIT